MDNVNIAGPKILFEIPLFGGIPITQTVISSFVVTLILCIGGILLGRNLKKRPGKLQVLTEKIVTMLYGMVRDTMGEHNLYWAPYIGTLFASSVLGSFIGMTGIFRSTTSDLSTVLVWAVMTSVLVWACTIKNAGLKSWLKGYINPMNIISDLAQPVSMSFRHFGNIMGGGVLTTLLYAALSAASSMLLRLISSNGFVVDAVVILLGGVVFFLGKRKKKKLRQILGIALCLIGLSALLITLGVFEDIPILTLGIPGLLSLYFDIFSGFVQALVFSLLTMVYVGSACPPPQEKTNP